MWAHSRLLSIAIAVGCASFSFASITTFTDYTTWNALAPSRTTIGFDDQLGSISNQYSGQGITFANIGNADVRASLRPWSISPLHVLDVNESSEFGGIGTIMTFSAPVRTFGFFYFDSQFSSTVSLSDSSNASLGTYALQGASPFVWRFFGVISTSADISTARVDIHPNDYVVLDNVSFGTVPEPATILALAGGLSVALRRRRSR